MSTITGLLLPLIVRLGSFDRYDHFNSPEFLSRAKSSPEPVLIITNFASIAAGAKTSAFTFDDHKIDPSSWLCAITLPSTSDTTNTPNPEAIPDERKLDCISQLTSPDKELIDKITPAESAIKRLFALKLGIKLPNVFSPLLDDIFQLVDIT